MCIQTVFANLNKERKRERLVYAHPFGKIKVHRQIDKMCVLFEFRIFKTLRTRLRISKFRVYLCKNLTHAMSLSINSKPKSAFPQMESKRNRFGFRKEAILR